MAFPNLTVSALPTFTLLLIVLLKGIDWIVFVWVGLRCIYATILVFDSYSVRVFSSFESDTTLDELETLSMILIFVMITDESSISNTDSFDLSVSSAYLSFLISTFSSFSSSSTYSLHAIFFKIDSRSFSF